MTGCQKDQRQSRAVLFPAPGERAESDVGQAQHGPTIAHWSFPDQSIQGKYCRRMTENTEKTHDWLVPLVISPVRRIFSEIRRTLMTASITAISTRMLILSLPMSTLIGTPLPLRRATCCCSCLQDECGRHRPQASVAAQWHVLALRRAGNLWSFDFATNPGGAWARSHSCNWCLQLWLLLVMFHPEMLTKKNVVVVDISEDPLFKVVSAKNSFTSKERCV